MPSEKEGLFDLLRLEGSSPASSAFLRTVGMPTSMPSCTYGVFTECTMASRRLIR